GGPSDGIGRRRALGAVDAARERPQGPRIFRVRRGRPRGLLRGGQSAAYLAGRGARVTGVDFSSDQTIWRAADRDASSFDRLVLHLRGHPERLNLEWSHTAP